MPVWDILFDAVLLLGSGLVLGVLAEKLKQSAMVGYLLAGMMVGPHVLGWVQGGDEVKLLAELGAALLLFSIGLEFSAKRLIQQGVRALLAGGAQITLTGLVTFGLMLGLGLSLKVAVVIGAAMALSSTACVIKLLRDRADTDSAIGRSTISILLVQDAAVVPLLLMVSALGQEGGGLAIVWQMLRTLLISSAAFTLIYVFLNKLVPHLLKLPQWIGNRDFPVLLTAVIALGTTWATHSFGLSPALGAFLAGLFLAESPFATQIRSDIEPLRVLLVTLFFGAIGMYADPVWIYQNAGLVGGTTLAVIIGKALVVYLVLRVFRFSGLVAWGSAFALAQMGEFSFLLLDVATGQSLLTQDLHLLLISITVISLLLTPYLLRLAFRERKRSQKKAADHAEQGNDPSEGRRVSKILIVGLGPAGFEVAKRLPESLRSQTSALDFNPKNRDQAEALGIKCHVGDASRQEVLEHAGAKRIELAIVTLPDPRSVQQILKLLKGINPRVVLLARGRYHRFFQDLMRSGADVVIDEEFEVGQQLAKAACDALVSRGSLIPFETEKAFSKADP